MKSYNTFKKELLRNKKIKQAYDALEPEFLLAEQIIKKRVSRGFTQTVLAKKIGTKQSAVARLESGRYNPSLALLEKVASALDARLTISLH